MIDQQIYSGSTELAMSVGHSGGHVYDALGYKGERPKLSQGSVLGEQEKL